MGLQVFGQLWRETGDCPPRTTVTSSVKPSSWHLLYPRPLALKERPLFPSGRLLAPRDP